MKRISDLTTGFVSLKRGFLGGALALGLMGLAAGAASSQTAAVADPNVTVITQTACQFVEAEGQDHAYETSGAADCKRINAKTADKRLGSAQPLKLKAGKHTFRVTNASVPYELGFYLRGSSFVSRLTLPKISGGGLVKGVTKDYTVDLKPGEYLISCPLNPTPDYKVIVE